MDVNRHVIYTPLEDILYNQGGLTIMLVIMLAAIPAIIVMVQIEKRASRFSKVREHNLWIGGGVFAATLFLIHLANIKGWI